MTQRISDRTFLVSSRDRPDGSWFHGYAMVGADVVIGAAGAQAFEAARARAITPGEDGCYFSLRRIGESLVAGCDHFGFKKLFLYAEDGLWAMSNSVTRLAQHLRANGRRLSLRRHQLAAWGLPGGFGSQLTTFETVYAEINLVPSTCDVHIDAAGVRVVRRPPAPPASYEVALHRYLSVWASRIVTLLHGTTAFATDLTGGRDSRIVTGLVLMAARLGEVPPERYFVRSGQQPPHADDLRVAQHLGEQLGFTVNPVPRPKVPGLSIPTAAAYDIWRQLNLGVYRPVYLSRRDHLGFYVQLGGGGGEAYRPFYTLKDPVRFARTRRKDFDEKRDWASWNDAFAASVALLEEHSALDAHPLILHYREFRNRCHAGRAPQVGVTVAPLASRLLDDCAIAIDPARLAENQILFDLMASIDRRLLDLPFDSPTKAPEETNLAHLTVVDVGPGDLVGGELFGAPDIPDHPEADAFDLTAAIGLMLEDFEASTGPAAALGVSAATIELGREQLTTSLDAGRFAHAVTPADAVRVVLAGDVARHLT